MENDVGGLGKVIASISALHSLAPTTALGPELPTRMAHKVITWGSKLSRSLRFGYDLLAQRPLPATE